MPRLELGADGMVRFDGRIIAEIAYFNPEFVDIIEAANVAFEELASTTVNDRRNTDNKYKALLKAGWWK